MDIKRLFAAFALGTAFLIPFAGHAEEVSTTNDVVSAEDSVFVETREFVLGRVTTIFGEESSSSAQFDESTQRVNVRLLNGDDAGTDQTVEYTTTTNGFEQLKLHEGDIVIASREPGREASNYVIMDKLRIPGVLIGFCAFLFLAIIFAGIRGVTSVFGLIASLAVLAFGVVPAIMHGYDPLTVCIIGSVIIAVVSILLAHGFSRRSFIALGATILTLFGAVLFSIVAVMLAKLSGSGTEEAIYLQVGSLPSLNLQGLLLGGMIIGTLGVLDDVTTAQVAAVEEIGIADNTLSAKELYHRGLRVGKEHIAALVNTLALAYAGASFPLFLLFSLEGGPPLWVVLNAEYVMEEVVRAIVGGASLVIAVPISTALAAYYFGKHKKHKYAR